MSEEEIPQIEPYRELWKREEQDNKELREEIERLNNIINELEKWLNEEKEATFYDYQFAIEDVLDKLRELKR